MKCDGQNILSFWTRFLPFYPLNNPKNQNFEKMKKITGDIIILHMCNINDNRMMYGSWDMEPDGQNVLSFWTIFYPFTPLKPEKSHFEKKRKKTLEDIISHKCVKNHDHMLSCS